MQVHTPEDQLLSPLEGETDRERDPPPPYTHTHTQHIQIQHVSVSQKRPDIRAGPALIEKISELTLRTSVVSQETCPCQTETETDIMCSVAALLHLHGFSPQCRDDKVQNTGTSGCAVYVILDSHIFHVCSPELFLLCLNKVIRHVLVFACQKLHLFQHRFYFVPFWNILLHLKIFVGLFQCTLNVSTSL